MTEFEKLGYSLIGQGRVAWRQLMLYLVSSLKNMLVHKGFTHQIVCFKLKIPFFKTPRKFSGLLFPVMVSLSVNFCWVVLQHNRCQTNVSS